MGRPKKTVAKGSETNTDKENRGAGKEAPEARTFRIAIPAETIGRAIITQHYPELKQQKLVYVFTSKAGEVDKQPVICKPHKIDGLSAWLATDMEEGEVCPFFAIVISEPHWNEMPQKGKEAFLDSALALCQVSKSGALKLGRPDLRETSAVLARHGLYSKKLKEQGALLKEALGQPALELAS